MTIHAADPVVQLTARGALSLLFFSATLHKLRHHTRFRTAMAQYDLLPPAWVAPAALALMTAETVTAVALWLPDLSWSAALAAVGLLLLYAGAIAVNLRRGRRDIDCGCGGPAGSQHLSGALVTRNIMLAALALICTLPSTGRPLLWIDGVTACAGVLAAALLYAASTGLVAAQSRLAAGSVSHEDTAGVEVAHA